MEIHLVRSIWDILNQRILIVLLIYERNHKRVMSTEENSPCRKLSA